MTKKQTRDTQETKKAWSREAPKNQAQERPKAQTRKTKDTRGAPKAQTAETRYSYFDCLCDKASAPAGVNGSTLYQLLMVSCMVLFVLTVNGVGESGIGFFAHSR